MRIGRLDRRIEIANYTDDPSDFDDTWGAKKIPEADATRYLNLWATKLDKPVGERAELGKDVSLIRTEFTTRFIDGSLHNLEFERFGTYFIKYKNEYYNVKGFEELGRKEGMKFHTEIRR